MRLIEKPPKVLIIRMRKVPIIDATGIKIIEEVYRESIQKGTKLILSEVDSTQIMEELKTCKGRHPVGAGSFADHPDAIEKTPSSELNGLMMVSP